MLTRETIMRRFQAIPLGFRNMRFGVDAMPAATVNQGKQGQSSGLQPKGSQCPQLFFQMPR
jgi:hypothetical protein